MLLSKCNTTNRFTVQVVINPDCALCLKTPSSCLFSDNSKLLLCNFSTNSYFGLFQFNSAFALGEQAVLVVFWGVFLFYVFPPPLSRPAGLCMTETSERKKNVCASAAKAKSSLNLFPLHPRNLFLQLQSALCIGL